MLRRFFARLAISLAALLITLIAAVIALVYFAYALFLVLLNVVVPPAAAVLTGVIILLAAILLVAATRTRSRRGRKRGASPTLEGFENAAELGAELGPQDARAYRLGGERRPAGCAGRGVCGGHEPQAARLPAVDP